MLEHQTRNQLEWGQSCSPDNFFYPRCSGLVFQRKFVLPIALASAQFVFLSLPFLLLLLFLCPPPYFSFSPFFSGRQTVQIQMINFITPTPAPSSSYDFWESVIQGQTIVMQECSEPYTSHVSQGCSHSQHNNLEAEVVCFCNCSFIPTSKIMRYMKDQSGTIFQCRKRRRNFIELNITFVIKTGDSLHKR